MGNVWLVAALWVGLALAATLLAIWLKVSTALSEIVVGTVAQLIIGAFIGHGSLGGSAEWITFLAGAGSILLTFLAGAELDPTVFRRKWREATAIGLIGFFAPFLGATVVARYLLGWDPRASWLAGVALSTTSVAVVYAVMLELGFNRTEFGKSILAACFINDLGTVIALGLIFSPFTARTVVFVAASLAVFALLPWLTPRFFAKYGGRVSELEAKFILFALFAMGGLAVWAGSEAVLPAYIIGMVLAGSVGRDHILVRRLRTVTFGLLTPFYFIRAGSFVSVPALVAAPMAFVFLFFAKMFSKMLGLFPVVRRYRYAGREAWYYTLMMSTGLTFGTISALFGLNHGIISQAQYSYLVATVIGSAVIPTMIANAFFMPSHLLTDRAMMETVEAVADGA
ncbi:MAG TPA: cation:proton antiporter [Vicinamibacterales bacterium]|nr:cation:proton antiporter [Vicinamibacterales bacterium]